MEKIFLWIQRENRKLFHFAMLLITAIVVVQFISREVQFYEYEKGKPWMTDDLIAPFTFSIIKSKAEIETEKNTLSKKKELFFLKREEVSGEQLEVFRQLLSSRLSVADSLTHLTLQENLSESGKEILENLFERGIIEIPEALAERSDQTLFLKEGVANNQKQTTDFYTISSAIKYIESEIVEVDSAYRKIVLTSLSSSLKPNVLFDYSLTQKNLSAKLNLILPNRGVVQKDETIIFKGNIVDELKLSKLNSLKVAYEGSFWKRANFIIIFVSRTILIFGILLLLYFVINNYYPSLLYNNLNLALILLHLIVVVALTALVKSLNPDWYFAVPVLLLPLVYMSFFNGRLSIIMSIVGILILGFLVPNGFEFVVIQSLMVLMVSVSYHGFLKRGQFFVTISKILLLYIVVYVAYSLMQEGSFKEIDYSNLMLFGISCFLGLFAIPILYIYERVFGLLSETTLLELSDTNNKLLRQLSESAPGTFQHTLQVASLAEKGVREIGGHVLLVRTGALYHDIGKLLNPQYFVENQITGVNPHDELSFTESAEIIINHVIKGIELARKNKLPDEIIDFIRTHHGTTRVEYFYRMYLKNYPKDESVIKEFTYPGPKPYSKETAVLMMADSIEAASRSVKEKSVESLKILIGKIIDSQVDSGQFNNADLSFKDITILKEVFLKALLNMYHLRIEYPE